MPTKSESRILSVIAIIYFVLAIFIPAQYFTDNNYSMGLAFRLLDWDPEAFSEHITGPLLGVLLTVPLAVGLAPLLSLGLVSATATLGVILASWRLLLAGGIPLPMRQWILILVAIWLVLPTFACPTPDMMGGALCGAATLMMARIWTSPNNITNPLWLGVIGALLYFTKHIYAVLFVAITILSLIFTLLNWRVTARKREFIAAHLLSLALTMLLCLPLVRGISVKYGFFAIGLQQFALFNEVDLTKYSPEADIHYYFAKSEHRAEGSYSNVSVQLNHMFNPARLLARSMLAARNVWYQATSLMFSGVGFLALILLIIFCKSDLLVAQISRMFVVLTVLLYLGTWGPHIRYYFVAIPPLILLSALSLHSLVQRAQKHSPLAPARLIVLFFTAACVSNPLLSATVAARNFSHQFEQYKFVIEANSAGLLQGVQGCVSGPIDYWTAGLLAYNGGFYYWNSIHPIIWENQELLISLLEAWKVSALIWPSDRSSPIRQLPGWKFSKQYTNDSFSLSVFVRELPLPEECKKVKRYATNSQFNFTHSA